MNKITFAVLAAGVVAASQAGAQTIARANSVPPGQRPPAGMCRVWIDGVAPGRQPRATTCAAARASAPANAIVVYGSDTPFPGRARGRFRDGDCNFERTSSNFGDIIFGLGRTRDADRDCEVRGSRELGVWYPTGRDANGNQIFSRRVRTADGRIVVERAQRNSAGQLVVVSSRNRASGVRRNDDDDDRNRTAAKLQRDRDHQLKKAQQDREKAARRANRAENRTDDRDDDDRNTVRRNNSNNGNNGNNANRGNSRGNSNGKKKN